MSGSESEQRGSKRIPVKLKVDCQCEGNFLFENATNISEHGIFIETTEPMSAGTMVDLQFTLPEERKAVEVLGEVIWTNPVRPNRQQNHNPGMGIRFVNMKEVDKEKILTLIKRIAVL
ncbi:MAG TPA: TIGR02266 family protein [Bdellovibrionota bacterium]|nr:TIGR02266 family protein [Bdellovibrionota bacterium]